MPPFDRALVFVVSLLIGGFAIHLAAYRLTGVDDYGRAILTALAGAVVWAIFDGVPLVGPILALIAWVGVLKWRYPVSWKRAVVIGVAAWAVAVIVLAVLDLIGIGGFTAFGVPGT